MTFRGRLVLATTIAVVVAILLASGAAYVYMQRSLMVSLDATLSNEASAVTNLSRLNQAPADSASELGDLLQIVSSTGQLLEPAPPAPLPITQGVIEVASGQAGTYYTTVSVGGASWREIVTPRTAGPAVGTVALQLATPQKSVDSQLATLRLVLALVAACGVALSILLGWLVGRTALRPLNDLTGDIEEMAQATDVSRRLDPGGVDELGRLRRAFNRLLEALEHSREQQRLLVLDASHELRTPLTSLRTNMEVARRLDALPVEERQVLVDDVVAQMDELTNLVGDMAELARGEHSASPRTLLRLDQLVEEAVALATTHGRRKGIVFELSTEPTTVVGHPERIARAVGNLLDNAVKWSPAGGTVEVTCHDHAVVVADHGPGIAPEDLPHVFDRFYRAPSARSLPGSGLGLAIVAKVASEEHASVTADNAPEGGAVFRLTFQPVPDAAPSRS